MRSIVAGIAVLVIMGVVTYVLASKTPPPIEIIATGRLPAGTTHLSLADSPRYRVKWMWRIELRSNAKRAARLSARLEDATPGTEISVTGETYVAPGATIKLTLGLHPPKAMGEFSGKAVLVSDDLPDWKHVYTFSGNVVDQPRKGAWLFLDRGGQDLGEVEAGAESDFRFTLENQGDKPVTIRDWSLPAGVRLAGASNGQQIPPGERREVLGKVKAPSSAGEQRYRIRFRSDAENAKLSEFSVLLSVAPDYRVDPPAIEWPAVYKTSGQIEHLVVHATKKVGPFTVAQVEGASLFDVAGSLATEPARAQKVSLRLRRDALPGRHDTEVRLRLMPANAWISIPVTVGVLDAINPQPALVNFGGVAPGGAVVPREVTLAHTRERTFKITQLLSTKGFFVPREVTRPGLDPRIEIVPVKNLPAGLYDDVIVIRTDHPDAPEVRVRAMIRIE